MGWGRIDDTFDGHPKRLLVSLAADGLLARAISRACRYGTNGWVEISWTRDQCAPRERARVVEEMLKHRLFEDFPAGETREFFARGHVVIVGPHTVDGYLIHDFLDYNPSVVELDELRGRDSRKKALHRDKDLVAAIRDRDGEHCRYCDITVDWRDRRGPTGATYDHIDPRGRNTIENVVVACRRCNSLKGRRTPDEAGMRLLPPRGAQMSMPAAASGRSGSRSDLDPDLSPRDGLGGEPLPEDNGLNDARAEARDSGPVLREVVEILGSVRRLRVDAVAIDSAIRAFPNGDPIKAAREVVAGPGTDTTRWQTHASRLLWRALEAQADPKPATTFTPAGSGRGPSAADFRAFGTRSGVA